MPAMSPVSAKRRIGIRSSTGPDFAGSLQASAASSVAAPPPIEAQLVAKDITCLDPPDGGRMAFATTDGSGYRRIAVAPLEDRLVDYECFVDETKRGAFLRTLRQEVGLHAKHGSRDGGEEERQAEPGSEPCEHSHAPVGDHEPERRDERQQRHSERVEPGRNPEGDPERAAPTQPTGTVS